MTTTSNESMIDCCVDMTQAIVIMLAATYLMGSAVLFIGLSKVVHKLETIKGVM